MTTHLELEDLFGLSVVGDVQLSPDGGSVAFTVSEIDAERDDYRTTIWLAPTGAGEPRRYSHGPGHDTAPRWSPDGRRLAFLSDRDGGQPQLYLLPTGGEARRLTDLEHGAGAAVWAPDGSLMLFSAWVPKEPPDDHRPKVITQAQYKMDSQGYTFGLRDQLFSLSLDSGEVRCLSDGAANDLAPAWSPGGVADFYLSDLWLMAADGSGARQLTSAVGRSLAPAWSPDGSLIACYGAANQGRSWGDPETLLWLVSVESGEARMLTLRARSPGAGGTLSAGQPTAAVVAGWHRPELPPGRRRQRASWSEIDMADGALLRRRRRRTAGHQLRPSRWARIASPSVRPTSATPARSICWRGARSGA